MSLKYMYVFSVDTDVQLLMCNFISQLHQFMHIKKI